MQLYALDPLSDRRWDELVASHPKSSAFHQSGWLRALAKTYSYRPVALTSTPPGEPLVDGIVFCEVRSWVTGNRLVSLPFSDHADPLSAGSGAPFEMAEWIRTQSSRQRWKYIEFRPLSADVNTGHPVAPSESFWLHTLDLTPSAEQLFQGLHKSCMQRRIRHAERQQLLYEKGSSSELLDEFYRLLTMTRRRFRLLPQPRAWFRNLLACMGQNAQIRIVRKDGKGIAAIFALCHRRTIVYKYGCSDDSFHPLGAMPLLFWKLIEESKSDGAELLDLGRTEFGNEGLVEFKDHFGACRTRLNYFRYPRNARKAGAFTLNMGGARKMLSVLPASLSSTLGRMAYRHIG
jgi:CelD/BcsL family acetyltransferase involved in cellulose biosynthesis